MTYEGNNSPRRCRSSSYWRRLELAASQKCWNSMKPLALLHSLRRIVWCTVLMQTDERRETERAKRRGRRTLSLHCASCNYICYPWQSARKNAVIARQIFSWQGCRLFDVDVMSNTPVQTRASTISSFNVTFAISPTKRSYILHCPSVIAVRLSLLDQ